MNARQVSKLTIYMIKGKRRREMPLFCEIVFMNHRFSKQMLKNQVLEIFSWKIFGGLEERLYLCIIKQ